MVPVECMTAPPEDWMCREVDDSHVDELYQSMKLNPGVSSLSEPNGLVIIDPKLADLALNNKITFDELVDYMKANPAYTYHGEHRRRACTNLHNVIYFLLLFYSNSLRSFQRTRTTKL